jgi:hypothetical protein
MSRSLKLPCAALAWQATQLDALPTEARFQTSGATSRELCLRMNQAVKVMLAAAPHLLACRCPPEFVASR